MQAAEKGPGTRSSAALCFTAARRASRRRAEPVSAGGMGCPKACLPLRGFDQKCYSFTGQSFGQRCHKTWRVITGEHVTTPPEEEWHTTIQESFMRRRFRNVPPQRLRCDSVFPVHTAPGSQCPRIPAGSQQLTMSSSRSSFIFQRHEMEVLHSYVAAQVILDSLSPANAGI